MELSERCIAQLENEGFEKIYEEKWSAGTELPIFSAGTVLLVTEGSLTNAEEEILMPGDRHRYCENSQLVTGPHGCQVVIGETNE